MSDPGATPTSPPPPPNASPPADPGQAGSPGGEQAGSPDASGSAEARGDAAADAGGETKGGTDQPGGDSDRHEHRRAALHQFGGDHVGRDKFVYYLSTGEKSPPPKPLSPTLQDFARHAFVTPDGWDRYRGEFRGRRSVLLGGRPGEGRATMAIRLLQTVEATGIFVLDPRADLSRMVEQLDAQPLKKGTAFLLHEPVDIARLNAHILHSLESALDAADARLVITVDNTVTFQDEDLLRYQMALPPAPDRRTILRQHLYHRIVEDQVEQILALPEVEELISTQLNGDGATCERASLLALLLSRDPDAIDVAHIRAVLHRRRADEFEVWFDGLDTVKLRGFAVALAVLHRLPYEAVASAARLLNGRLSNGGRVVLGENNTLRVAGGDPFQPSQEGLLRILQARLVEATERTPYGEVPASAIAFRNPEYRQRVIERAWKSYQLADKLLGWLGELVATGSSQVRTYAGAALGAVATFAFDYVTQRVLVPWAYHEDLRKNEAVADALAVAAGTPALRAEVALLVDGWYASGDPDAQCTAALALGTRLGQPDATRAIQALERLTTVDHPSVRVGIARGFATLIADDPARAAEMYSVVGRCLADPKRTYTGVYLFLYVAGDINTDVSAASGAPVRWPALLYLASKHGKVRHPLFISWVYALTTGHAPKLAELVLRAWAGYAETDPGVCEAFTRMVRSIAQLDRRAGAVVSRSVQRWNSPDELMPLPAVVSAINRVLVA